MNHGPIRCDATAMQRRVPRIAHLGIAALLLLGLANCRELDAQQQRSVLRAPQLEELVRRASRSKTYRPALPAEIEEVQRLFERTLRGKESVGSMRSAWLELGFQLDVHQAGDDEEVWLLSETDLHPGGRGFYAIRPEGNTSVAIQAPHSFADLKTRQIAVHLFLDGDSRAAAWNTVHRRTVDLAHTDASFYNAFTRAFVEVHGNRATVCQLHGFATDKRTSAAGRRADLILSNGTRSPSYWLHRATQQLAAVSPRMAVKIYPNEVLELGGTTNQQASTVREAGVGRFMHLEMSVKLRKELVDSPQARADYLKIIGNVGRSEEVSAK